MRKQYRDKRQDMVRKMDDALSELIDDSLKEGMSSEDVVTVLANHLYGDIEGRRRELHPARAADTEQSQQDLSTVQG